MKRTTMLLGRRRSHLRNDRGGSAAAERPTPTCSGSPKRDWGAYGERPEDVEPRGASHLWASRCWSDRWHKMALVVLHTSGLVILCGITTVMGQSGAKGGEWRTYGGDLGSTRYAPIDEITAENFNTLEIAWRFKTQNFGPQPDLNLQATPLMVNGVLYTTAGTRRTAAALDAATGELLWMYRLDEGERAENAPRRRAGRGVAYWTDGESDERIFLVTTGYRLVALDAKTGKPLQGFGRHGMVDLKQDLDQVVDPVTGEIGLHAAPVVADDVVIIGAAHRPGATPESRRNVKGYVRGYDVRTGRRLWIFHTIPRPGQFGIDTWKADSWEYTGNTGVWAQISVDEELGIAYLPIETSTGDYYGGHRPGANLFAESLVAVDLHTGERIWHYQLIHHGIWDFDIPSAPILADITVDGGPIKAVAQPTKQGFLYVFDRQTGAPIWPIEERPVPQSDVPGEQTSPTQPFPTKPPAFARQGLSVDDLIDFTPTLRAEAEQLVALYKIGPLFTPQVVRQENGPLGLLMLPSIAGGASWPGGSYDPDTGILYVYSRNEVAEVFLFQDPEASDMEYIAQRSGRPRVQGLPLIKPPWGTITAIDLNRGEIVWQVAHGETPDQVREHDALQGLEIARTGQLGRVGTLTTKSVVIAGESLFTTTSSGKRGAMLRAYDKATGAEVGAVYMPAPQTGSPMTYMLNGKQYIIVAVGGSGFPAELLAYTLP